jgi:hypothetical protein
MNKEKISVVIGLLLPVIFIIFVAIFISVRTSSVQPQFSFIYAASSETSPQKYGVVFENNYVVTNGKITLKPISRSKDILDNYDVRKAMDLYLYDMKTETNQKITIEEAQKYVVSDDNISPDGYRVSYEYGNGGIFEMFGGNGSNYGYFVTKVDSGAKKKLNVATGENYWNNEFNVIGWVK